LKRRADDRIGSVVLCSWCASRQGRSPASKKRLQKTNCAICRGSLDSLPRLATATLASLKGYQFETFLVGSSVSQDLIDSEDEFRSRFKIKGKQSIKGQISRYVGSFVAKKTRKKLERSRPDLTILLAVPSNAVSISSRSIWLSALYRKTKRGIAQRSSICRVCNGVGCSVCNYKGATSETLQSMATEFFSELFSAEGCNFIWIGNEDDQSLVGGKGRPFFVEVLRPKKRPIGASGKSKRRKFEVPKRVALNGILLKSIRVLQTKPTDIPQVEMKCRVYLKWKNPENPLSPEQLDSLGKAIQGEFSDRLVRIKLSKRYKSISRKIRYASLSRSQQGTGDLACTLEIGAEGGVPIRKLVTGSDEVDPNFGKFLESFVMDPLRPFDVIDIESKQKLEHAPNAVEAENLAIAS
jgi:tRNA pseudouridine synthase 10